LRNGYGIDIGLAMLTRDVSDIFSVGGKDWKKIGSFRAGQIFREAVEIADPDVRIS
jgi:hypothetical protein